MKKNKKTILIICSVILFLIIGIASYSLCVKYQNKLKETQQREELKKHQELLQDIKNHYSHRVITTTNAALYKKINNDYVESGYVSKNVYFFT